MIVETEFELGFTAGKVLFGVVVTHLTNTYENYKHEYVTQFNKSFRPFPVNQCYEKKIVF